MDNPIEHHGGELHGDELGLEPVPERVVSRDRTALPLTFLSVPSDDSEGTR